MPKTRQRPSCEMVAMEEENVFVKVWKAKDGEVIMAICDCEILGKRIQDGALILDVSREFFGGEKMSKEAAIDLIKSATIANFVGEVAVKCGIEAGLVHKEAIITIGGIPHAQFVMML